MIALKRTQGRHATLQKHAKKPNHLFVGFSKLLSQEIKEKGFKGGKVLEAKPGILKIRFTNEPLPYPIYVNKDGRAQLVLDPEISKEIFGSIFLPEELGKRKASVSWEQGNVIVLRFPWKFFLPKEVNSNELQPLNENKVKVYVNPKYHYAYLEFSANQTRYFKSKGIKGFCIHFENFPVLILEPREKCWFDCKKCPQIECTPIHWDIDQGSRISIWQILSYIFGKEVLSLSKIEGKIFRHKKDELIVVILNAKGP